MNEEVIVMTCTVAESLHMTTDSGVWTMKAVPAEVIELTLTENER